MSTYTGGIKMSQKIVVGLLLALLATSCGRGSDVNTSSASGTRTGSRSKAPLKLLLRDEYRPGHTARVGLRNNSERPFIYNPEYQACDMTYRDGEGRKFIIPPGTHCDLQTMMEIAPGQSVTLFNWKLDECIKDRWGCVKSESLPPGTYRIRGSFKPATKGDPVTVGATFNIIEP